MNNHIKLLVAIFLIGQSCVQHKIGMGKKSRHYNTRKKNVVPTTQYGKVDKYENVQNDWLFKHVFGEVITDPNNNDNENPYTLKLLNSLLELEGDQEIEGLFI